MLTLALRSSQAWRRIAAVFLRTVTTDEGIR
jgi:hypothetical protein